MSTATLTQTTRTLSSSKGKSVVTPLTDIEAMNLCAGMVYHGLASSLAQQFSGPRGLSQHQLVWLHILANEELARQQAAQRQTTQVVAPVQSPTPATVTSIGGFSRLQTMFNYALKYHQNHSMKVKAERAIQPRIFFVLPWGSVCVKLAGQSSKWCGQLMVTETDKYGSTYYGRIDVNGHFHPSNNQNPNILPFLQTFAANPSQVARQYGQKTGNCCFCKRHVKDEKGDRDAQGNITNFGSSVDNGYGLVCSRRFDLYHAHMTMAEKKDYALRHPDEQL